MITLHQLLKATVKQGASDLHIVAGSPPILRINGRVVRIKTGNLTSADTQRLCYSILTDGQKSQFENKRDFDFSFGIKDLARFRANMFFQRGMVSGVFRRIPFGVPELDSLDLPSVIGDFANYPNGLVLVTGPTGSGKSTTLAALIDKINRERRGHIVTMEDPIEYVHTHKSCIVNQREISVDTGTYADALKYVLRQDPDVCLLGEMRDPETMEAALSIAETGHLVFATVHTNSSVDTISRIVSSFSANQQDRVRSQISMVLRAVLSQRLIPSAGDGMAVASEVLVVTPGIANLIRENKMHQLYGIMQVGQQKTGMQTLNQSLFSLVMKRKIEVKTAFEYSPDPEELDKILKKAGV